VNIGFSDSCKLYFYYYKDSANLYVNADKNEFINQLILWGPFGNSYGCNCDDCANDRLLVHLVKHKLEVIELRKFKEELEKILTKCL
jgi:hypothetical protein